MMKWCKLNYLGYELKEIKNKLYNADKIEETAAKILYDFVLGSNYRGGFMAIYNYAKASAVEQLYDKLNYKKYEKNKYRWYGEICDPDIQRWKQRNK